tara:strand:- start:1029 stop:1163 length:135 start_codon:yes stop_codon:yes gene_type:complete
MFEPETSIAEVRLHLIEQIDKVRDLLEEILQELGASDPSSGAVV